MKKLSLIGMLVVSAIVLSACGTTETKAPVVEKSAGTSTKTAPTGPQVETQGLAAGAGEQTEALGNGPSGIVGIDAADAAKLKDANNILSKRIVYFDFDKSNIKPEFNTLIAAHAEFLKGHPKAGVVLEGNTDERGSREYNMALGQRRADSVKKTMEVLGVADSQMETISYGEEKPAAMGHNEAAWRLNRRTVIHYKGE